MRPALRISPIAALVVVAGLCGWASYGAFSPRASGPDPWTQASAAARAADRTRAQVPAMRMRSRAIELFRSIAESGAPEARSRAAMLQGLLILGNAGSDPGRRRELLSASAASLRRAVRLDRANDDAAYDLELLLAQAKASHQTILQTPNKKQSSRGSPSSGRPGSGY